MIHWIDVLVSLVLLDRLHLAMDNQRVDTIRQWRRHWVTKGPPMHHGSEKGVCDMSKILKYQSE